MSEHGGRQPGPEGKKAAQFMMALAAVSARALLSAHGYNVERTLKVLDTWAAEYSADPAAAMTAARHVDQYAAVPGHDEIVAIAPAAVYSCLVGDSYTQVAIDRERADMGATPDEVASTFVVMAAAMLVEACGGKAEASALAARWTRRITARSARAVNARGGSAA